MSSPIGYVPMPALLPREEDTIRNATGTEANGTVFETNTMSQIEKISVVTKTDSNTNYINWSIDANSLHIAKLAPKGDKRGVITAEFERAGFNFKVELCASGWRNSNNGFCAFYLTVEENTALTARYRVQIGELTRLSSIRHDFNLGVGFPNFCESNVLETLLENGSLDLLVSIEIFDLKSQVFAETDIFKKSHESQRDAAISNLLHAVYTDRLHTDVVLMTRDGRRIPVHKCVLSAASPVFKAMFGHNFLENQLNEVPLMDFEPKIIDGLVKFIYTGSINGIIENTGSINAVESSDMDLSDCEDEELENINGLNVDSKTSDSMIFEDVKLNLFNVFSACDGKNVNQSTGMNNVDYNSISTRMISYDTSDLLELFRFAEMYEIQSMVISCCTVMYQELSIENACLLLTRMHRYSHVPHVQIIQKSIWNFILSNIREIKNTSNYRILQNNPQLMIELVDKMTK